MRFHVRVWLLNNWCAFSSFYPTWLYSVTVHVLNIMKTYLAVSEQYTTVMFSLCGWFGLSLKLSSNHDQPYMIRICSLCMYSTVCCKNCSDQRSTLREGEWGGQRLSWSTTIYLLSLLYILGGLLRVSAGIRLLLHFIFQTLRSLTVTQHPGSYIK